MKYNISINDIKIIDGKLSIHWSCRNVGFGVLDIIINKEKDNILKNIVDSEEFLVYTEHMGREFYEQILNKTMSYLLANSKICE